MDTATQQLMYRAFIVTFCVTTGLILLFMMGSAVVLGDGEAIKIIDALKPVAIGNIAAMATAITAHQWASASVSKAQAVANAGLPVATPAALPVAATPPDVRADGTVGAGNG